MVFKTELSTVVTPDGNRCFTCDLERKVILAEVQGVAFEGLELCGLIGGARRQAGADRISKLVLDADTARHSCGVAIVVDCITDFDRTGVDSRSAVVTVQRIGDTL